MYVSKKHVIKFINSIFISCLRENASPLIKTGYSLIKYKPKIGIQ